VICEAENFDDLFGRIGDNIWAVGRVMISAILQKSFCLRMMYVQKGMFNDYIVDLWIDGGWANIKGWISSARLSAALVVVRQAIL
jgi:hypothetical protein